MVGYSLFSKKKPGLGSVGPPVTPGKNDGKEAKAELPPTPPSSSEKAKGGGGGRRAPRATYPMPSVVVQDGNSRHARVAVPQQTEFGQLGSQAYKGPAVTSNGNAARPTLLSPNGQRANTSRHVTSPMSGVNRPAYAQEPSKSSLGRRMSTGSLPPSQEHGAGAVEELQLYYGYWPIETQRELNLLQVEEIVSHCAKEIKARGLEHPLLFSTQALDISLDGICSLIRSYLANPELWRKDLRFANPHDLCGSIKWALGRYVNPQGARGFLSWETYERWRFSEQEQEFPPRHITTHMLYTLPTQIAGVLSALLDLMSSAIAYTTKNGCTTRKLATLFSSFIFGLPDDATFEQTYTAFCRFSHATEHLLLAFIRDQTAQQVATPIPTRIQEVVQDYPQCLPVNLNKPPPSATMQRVVRIRRHVRFYSKNLIASAGSWDVPRSQSWATVSPFPSKSKDGKSAPPPPFAYSGRYRHLLNIRGLAEDEEDADELQRFGSAVEKEWSSFLHTGFAPPDQSKLKFDLTESARTARFRKHETLTWDAFTGIGFAQAENEKSLNLDLAFDPAVNDSVRAGGVLSEEHKTELAEKARQIEKFLPAFNYDITPREEQSLQVDRQFFEVFCDVLCSSGWTRDEVKESNWSLIQYKTRPQNLQRPPSIGSDGRTEETWFLVEELIPADYRAALSEGPQKPKSNRRISFLRSVRKKGSNKPVPALPVISAPLGLGSPPIVMNGNQRSKTALPFLSPSRNGTETSFEMVHNQPKRSVSPSSLRTPDESIFQAGGGGQTKQLSLSRDLSLGRVSQSQEESESLDDHSAPLSHSLSRQETGNAVAGSHTGHQGANAAYQGAELRKTPSDSAKAGSGFMDRVRRGTRRHKHTNSREKVVQSIDRQSPSASPVSTVGSPAFDYGAHGVAGAGQPIGSPALHVNDEPHQYAQMKPQMYERAPPSFSGTNRSIETRGTSGHSDGQTIRGSPMTAGGAFDSPSHAHDLMHPKYTADRSPTPADGRYTPTTAPDSRPSEDAEEGRDSASTYERDLPAPPESSSNGALAVRDAKPSGLRDSVASDNPYDGMESSTEGGHGDVAPAAQEPAAQSAAYETGRRDESFDQPERSPVGDSVWRGSKYEAPPRTSSASSVTRQNAAQTDQTPQAPQSPKMFLVNPTPGEKDGQRLFAPLKIPRSTSPGGSASAQNNDAQGTLTSQARPRPPAAVAPASPGMRQQSETSKRVADLVAKYGGTKR